jgi:protein SCO1/2
MTRATTAALALVAAGCATVHPARGLVLRVEPATRTVTVSHEEIPGFMDAMVMPLRARDAKSLDGVRPGDRIEFVLRVSRNETRIDRIRPLSATRVDSGLVKSPAAPVLVDLGQIVPDFSLVDQDGRDVTLSSLRGRVVAVNFIYSRCPLPDYCPRMISNFREVRQRFSDRLSRDLTLLTISFDPKYDTPEVLKAYARRQLADVPGWRFLTGPDDAIARACASFGIEYWPDEGLITHTLQTAVIDREGRLAATVEGKDFTARQIADLVESVLDR